MTILVPITLIGWIVVATGLFAVLRPRRAVLTAYILSWLFLPHAAIPFEGWPDLDKVSATSLGALLGVVLFDAGRLLTYRPSWVDIPVVIWCLSAIPSSVANELGLYDGLATSLSDILLWGIPYFLGRLYFNTFESLRELAIGIFIGGLIYVPLCAWEIRMSPHLHEFVYGFRPSHFAMTKRYGGFRPTVFMQHGLMVGMWMTCTTLVGVWLWSCGSLKQIARIPMSFLVPVLALVTILCKSTGSLILLLGGFVILFGNKLTRLSVLVGLAVVIAPAYMYVRTNERWAGDELIKFAQMINLERAESLGWRLENEELVLDKAAEKPAFGWGGWGRWRVYDDFERDITVSDGMWIIVRGSRGLVGLVSVTIVILLPFLLLLFRLPARHWDHPVAAPAAALAMMLLLFSIDNLFNAMLIPIYLLAAGALSGFYVSYPQWQAFVRRSRLAEQVISKPVNEVHGEENR